MESQNKNSILATLQGSGLNEEDQIFWFPRIHVAPQETQASIIEFLTTVRGGAEWLRAIQEEKE